jgi:hypothetical protein
MFKLCLIILALCCLYLTWTLHVSMARLVERTEVSMAFAKDKIATVMSDRNQAESHVLYLEKELDKWHKANFKQGKSGDPKEKVKKK